MWDATVISRSASTGAKPRAGLGAYVYPSESAEILWWPRVRALTMSRRRRAIAMIFGELARVHLRDLA
jgi:hypothetical protein